ncbi:MAG: DNA primase [Pseudomonadota bacterium]
MRFPPSLLDDIRNRIPISEIVGQKVTWDRRKSQPAKGDHWACCPFHQEKTPSFHCDDRRGRYHCFGCGASGDHFRFLTETEGFTFPEAVERLAERAGVRMPEPDPEAGKREQRRVSLRDVMVEACRFFESRFRAGDGAEARAYAERRGLTAATLSEFRVGYAPDSRNALKSHLSAQGIDESAMAEAGLIIRPDDGRPAYDRFRGRLIIPIEDERGRVVAFGGRVLASDREPKYLNSPETPLFNKSTTLFNAHRVRKTVREAGTAIVVEGYLDAIAVYQAGVKTVVAALGTAFTEDQIARLWRLAPEPVICFDGDKAGKAAAYRAVDRILPSLKGGCSFNFVFLPNGQDPDDLIQSGGRTAFMTAVRNAVPLADVLWQREVAGARLDTPERQAALEKAVNQLVFSIQDETVQRSYRLAMRVRLSELFWSLSRRGRRERPAGGVQAGAGEAVATPLLAQDAGLVGLERIVLGLSIAFPSLFERHIDRMTALQFSLETHGRLRDELERLTTTLDASDAVTIAADADPRFFALIREVYGEIEGNGPVGETGTSGKGTKLTKRVPFLRLRPPESFVEEYFEHLLDRFDLRAMEAERDEEIAQIGSEGASDAEARILDLTREITKRREIFTQRDQAFAEEARQFRPGAEEGDPAGMRSV